MYRSHLLSLSLASGAEAMAMHHVGSLLLLVTCNLEEGIHVFLDTTELEAPPSRTHLDENHQVRCKSWPEMSPIRVMMLMEHPQGC
eukprot:38613-Chlamydomonas_euryale.AAC.5